MAVHIELAREPAAADRAIEIVERKGLGHPDTICDMLSEALSVALSRHYIERFGLVLHHNVDKALLSAGRSEPAFAGGRILEPIDIYLSGRATIDVRGEPVPLTQIAEATVDGWLRRHMHALDPAVGVRVHCIAQPGSSELVELFMRQHEQSVPLANDTSCGVGFAPLSELERLVLAVERHLNSAEVKQLCPETGEDIKVMAIREGERISLTIACAFIGRFLADLTAYREARERLRAITLEQARVFTSRPVEVHVNTADHIERGDVYLTVSGTSAECGDDGETGRGNRLGGLITPCRPMTLEAMAGKNPITHVGKLYNLAASRLAEALVAEVEAVRAAECYLVSQIGAPIDQPRIVSLRLWLAEPALAAEAERLVRDIARRETARIPRLWHEFLAGTVCVA